MKAAVTPAIALALLTACLTGCAGQPLATSTATATDTPTPLATPSATATDTPAPLATPSPPSVTNPPPSAATAISDEDRAAISASISGGNVAALTPYLDDPTIVALCGSGGIGPVAPAEVVRDMRARLETAVLPWDFALPASTITDYRAKAYGSYFPPDGLVARSADTQILAFSFTGARISTVFLCPDEGLVLEEN